MLATRQESDEMILTRKQAERVVKQGKFKKDAIIKILRSMDFPVFDMNGLKKSGNTDLMIYNTNGTVTRIVKDGSIGLSVRIETPVKSSIFE